MLVRLVMASVALLVNVTPFLAALVPERRGVKAVAGSRQSVRMPSLEWGVSFPF